jgi:hypothetical protein
MILNNGERPGIIPSKGQQVKSLTLRLGELERERDAARKQVEQLKQIVAMRQVAINALGTHFDVGVEQMKEIINTFMDAEQKRYEQLTKEAKEKYIAGVRDGTAPDIQIIPNPDKQPDDPNDMAPLAPLKKIIDDMQAKQDNVEPFKQPE